MEPLLRPTPITITIEDHRDYARRKGLKEILELPDHELQAIVDAGNELEQAFYDEMEKRREQAKEIGLTDDKIDNREHRPEDTSEVERS